MSKLRKPPRTQQQKLRDALDAAHQALAACTPSGMWPNQQHAERFAAYSHALRAVVYYHLATHGWEPEPGSWSWDGYDRVFAFEYDGCAHLARSGDPLDRDRLWVRTLLSCDPKLDLDQELARLGTAASRYRDAVALMERETFRAHVRSARDT
jgi:hypothetical protein